MNSDSGKIFFKSREVKVGDLTIGGKNPVWVQTMTNTSTLDTKKTAEQIERVVNLGCHIVRVAVPSIKDADNLINIKNELKNRNINIPLVADIHYSPAIAEKAARIVEKVRVNPGNFISDTEKTVYSERDFINAKEKISANIQPLLEVCKYYGTALRIGVNWGSLSKRVLYRYGNTPEGMVASALEFMDILLDSGFENFTLSLKASDVKIMQKANILLVKKMIERDLFFPLHLGVTEAGDGISARVKSSTGIGALLQLGIGDTVRVSLTEAPENEIPVAKKLISFSKQKRLVNINELNKIRFEIKDLGPTAKRFFIENKPLVISKNIADGSDIVLKNDKLFTKNGENKINDNDLEICEINSKSNENDFIIESSVKFSHDFLKRGVNAILLTNENFSGKELVQLSEEIFQALGLRYSKAEYIACPSCGRTRFVIFDKLKEIKERTSHLKGVKIAIMGCNVNGPGEMADADYGYVGTGKGKVTIYKNGKPFRKNVPEEEATEVLIKILESGTKAKR